MDKVNILIVSRAQVRCQDRVVNRVWDHVKGRIRKRVWDNVQVHVWVFVGHIAMDRVRDVLNGQG